MKLDFLNNNYACSVTFGGIVYPSVTHALIASRFIGRDFRILIARSTLEKAMSLKYSNQEHTPGWEDREEFILKSLVRQKFQENMLLQTLLLNNRYHVRYAYENKQDHNVPYLILMDLCDEYEFLAGYSRYTPLEEALISDNPDEALVHACSEMYDGVTALMGLIDVNDFSWEFVSSRTGLGERESKGAIEVLNKMVNALQRVRNLVER